MASDPTPEPLKQAAEHLRRGEFEPASQQLASFLQQNPGSADGWVLFSYAMEDPVRKLECVERALQLEPEHAQAASRMQELRRRYPTVQTTWARPAGEPAGAPDTADAGAGTAEAAPGEAPPAPAQGETTSAAARDPFAAGPTPEPVTDAPAEPTPEPVRDAPAGPTPEPVLDVPAGPTPEPVLDAPAEPTPEPVADAPAELTPEPVADAPAGPTPEPVIDAPTEPTAMGGPEAAGPVPPFSVPLEAPTPEEQAGFLTRSPQAAEAQATPAAQPAERVHAVGAAPAQPAVRPERAKRPTRGSRLALALGLLFGCALAAGALVLVYSMLRAPGVPPAARPTGLPAVGATSAVSPVVLPPSWTPTVTPTVTPTYTPEPTRTPTATATFQPPNPTQLASMADIQLEVADLRGLAMQGSVESFLITRLKARTVLEDMYRSAGGSEAQLEDEKRELVALGLVKPTYNMVDMVLNSMADAVGGFFDPLSKRLFVIGGSLGALERFVYSHEFAHALVDQHYPLIQLGAHPICQHDRDRCRAITGLVEGDATLIMSQWLGQFASPQDRLDLWDYTPPPQALPEQFPPPFTVKDSEFAYRHGTAFVRFLHARGSWAEVNRAYGNLPQSSEQILHPEKYLAGERPQAVQPPPLDGQLGEGWRLLASESLGEWGTFLLLGYGADLEAQLPDDLSQAAAQGWGGDRYQAYYHEASGQTLLAALWRWDGDAEAAEFHTALHQHLNSRFRGQIVDLGAGACWQGPGQVSCSYRRGAGVLWILAPDPGTLQATLGAYAGFP